MRYTASIPRISKVHFPSRCPALYTGVYRCLSWLPHCLLFFTRMLYPFTSLSGAWVLCTPRSFADTTLQTPLGGASYPAALSLPLRSRRPADHVRGGRRGSVRRCGTPCGVASGLLPGGPVERGVRGLSAVEERDVGAVHVGGVVGRGPEFSQCERKDLTGAAAWREICGVEARFLGHQAVVGHAAHYRSRNQTIRIVSAD